MKTEDSPRKFYTLNEIQAAVEGVAGGEVWSQVKAKLSALEVQDDGLDISVTDLLTACDTLLTKDSRGFTLDELLEQAQVFSMNVNVTKRILTQVLISRGFIESQIRKAGKRPLVWRRK